MFKASGSSFEFNFEKPIWILHSRVWRSSYVVTPDAVPEPIVEYNTQYINPDFTDSISKRSLKLSSTGVAWVQDRDKVIGHVE